MIKEQELLSGKFKVISITADDLSLIVDLEKECGLNSRGLESYRKKVGDPNAILMAAVSGGNSFEEHEIIGLFSGDVVIDELQIDNLAVKESCRRSGVGRTLLKSALLSAWRLGAVTAVLEVRSANLPARALYKRQGFVVSGVRKGYYSAPPDDALLLACKIDLLAL